MNQKVPKDPNFQEWYLLDSAFIFDSLLHSLELIFGLPVSLGFRFRSSLSSFQLTRRCGFLAQVLAVNVLEAGRLKS